MSSSRPANRGALVALFGENGDQRDAVTWGEWLRQQDAGRFAVNQLNRLESQGCNRVFVLGLLMEIHATFLWIPLSGRDVEKARRVVSEAERLVRQLAQSNLRERLGLVPNEHEQSLENWLAVVRDNFEDIEPFTGQYEDSDFDRSNAIAELIRHVVEATGRQQDEALDAILSPIFGRPFSTRGWRRRHNIVATPTDSPGKKPKRHAVHRVSRRRARHR